MHIIRKLDVKRSSVGYANVSWLDQLNNHLSIIIIMKIFDSHLHFGEWGTHTINNIRITPFKNHEHNTYKKLDSYLMKNNITKAVVVPVYHSNPETTFKINSELIEVYNKLKNKIIPGLWVNPSPCVRSQLLETLSLCTKNKIKVLKTSASVWEKDYSPDPSTWDNNFKKGIELIFEYLIDNDAIFQIHSGSNKSKVVLLEKLIRNSPIKIKYHLVHMGNNVSGCFYLIPRLTKWISEGLNIVCDTSGVSGFALRWIVELIKKESYLMNYI